jgi:hypothetical protein
MDSEGIAVEPSVADQPLRSIRPFNQPSGRPAAIRDKLGRFGPANPFRLKHRRYSKLVVHALLPEQTELLSTLAAKEAAMFADLGGKGELSTMELDLVARYQQRGNIADYNASRMLKSRPAVRREAIAAFMAAVDRQLKILNILGTARRSKPLDATPGPGSNGIASERSKSRAASHRPIPTATPAGTASAGLDSYAEGSARVLLRRRRQSEH